MVQGVTTEWEDIQVKMGNWKAVEKPPTANEEWEHAVDMAEYYDPRAQLNL